MISGVINVYKEKGMTSHDVIWHLRHILQQKKIGHTGTLDPDAEGVLPVCLGMGTRLCDYLQQGEKVYQAGLLLGVTTDTQDISGTVLQRQEVEVSADRLTECVSGFAGPQLQLPPMYSALKVGGKKLCDLARKGIEVERKERKIIIHSIRVERIDLPRAVITVTCSRGTYIRTLCEDIGRALGCGGCMESLVRLQVGSFKAEDALRLEEIRQLQEKRALEAHILPVDHFFPEAGKAAVLPDCDRQLHNGNAFRQEKLILQENHCWTKTLRVFDSEGHFVGIFEKDESSSLYRPKTIFWQQ